MKTSDVLNESDFDFSLIQNMIFYFMTNCDFINLKNRFLNWQTSYVRFRAEFKRDQTLFDLSSFTIIELKKISSMGSTGRGVAWVSELLLWRIRAGSPCCYRNKLPEDRRRESHAANKLTGQQQL